MLFARAYSLELICISQIAIMKARANTINFEGFYKFANSLDKYKILILLFTDRKFLELDKKY